MKKGNGYEKDNRVFGNKKQMILKKRVICASALRIYNMETGIPDPRTQRSASADQRQRHQSIRKYEHSKTTHHPCDEDQIHYGPIVL